MHRVSPTVRSTGYSLWHPLSRLLQDLFRGSPLCRKHLYSVCHRAASACRSSVHSCFPPPSHLTTSPSICQCSCPCKAPLRGITASSSPLKHNPRRRIWDSFTHTALTHYPPPIVFVCGGQVSTGSLGTDPLVHICALCPLSCFDTGLLSVSLTTVNTF